MLRRLHLCTQLLLLGLLLNWQNRDAILTTMDQPTNCLACVCCSTILI